MPFDPEEYGQPADPTGTSEPVDLASILAIAAQGDAIAAQAGAPVAQQTAKQAAVDPQRLARAKAARDAHIQRVMSQRAVQSPRPVPAPPVVAPSALDEIEQRLAIAGYYRSFLSEPFFDEEDQYTVVVEQEVRAFILERLGDLLGTSKPKPPVEVKLPFSGREMQVLRLLANAVLSRKPPAAAVASARPLPVEEPEPEFETEEVAPPAPPPPAAPPQRRRARRPGAKTPKLGRDPFPKEEPSPSADPTPTPVVPPPQPAVRPIPIPQGAAFTAVTASRAAAEAVETAEAVEKTRSSVRR